MRLNILRINRCPMDDCLYQDNFLSHPIAYQDIDMIIFVSSTGVATPSLDAHLINERPFRQDVQRMPLWGLGCAGGAIGLARAKVYRGKSMLTQTAMFVVFVLDEIISQGNHFG